MEELQYSIVERKMLHRKAALKDSATVKDGARKYNVQLTLVGKLKVLGYKSTIAFLVLDRSLILSNVHPFVSSILQDQGSWFWEGIYF